MQKLKQCSLPQLLPRIVIVGNRFPVEVVMGLLTLCCYGCNTVRRQRGDDCRILLVLTSLGHDPATMLAVRASCCEEIEVQHMRRGIYFL